MLRIHDLGFARAEAEEAASNELDAVEDAAGLDVARIVDERRGSTPAASSSSSEKSEIDSTPSRRLRQKRRRSGRRETARSCR